MKQLPPLVSRYSPKLFLTRLVVLLTLMTAILFVIGAPNVIHSAGSPKSESSRVTPFSGPLTVTVNTLGDAADTTPGDGLCDSDSGTAGEQCTLRAAVQEANAVSSNDTINFSLPANSTITLNTSLPAFLGNITIAGPGASSLTIQRSTSAGTPDFRIFSFVPINGNFNDSISGLTIANGLATVPAFGTDSGGCIYNESPGILTMTDTVIRGSSARNGGGIYNTGTLTLTNSIVKDNQTTGGGSGGGIYSQGTLTLTNSTVSNNQTGSGDPNGGSGGGLFFQSGTATLTNSIISGNKTGDGSSASSHGGDGGGISATGMMTLTNSTVSGNTTGNGGAGAPGGYGGGIYGIATLTLNNSTISGNQTGSGMTTGAGGGIMNGGSAALTNSTVSGNQIGAANQGGGIFNYGTLTLTNGTVSNNSSGNSSSGGGIFNSSTTNLKDTIVANNTANGVGNDLSGTFNSQDYNLIEAPAAATISGTTTHNIIGQDPNLGPLANNGGPTQTHALLAASPAIDAGNTSQTMDQRGQPRPIDDLAVVNAAGGNATDIGAYEAKLFQVNTTLDEDDGACTALGTGDGCTLREAINAANAATFTEISFAPSLTSVGPATINLLTLLPSISSAITIQGPGSNLLNIQRSTAVGTPDFRVFLINSGKSLTITGVTISNGSAVGTFPSNLGGNFFNSGTLVINNCSVNNAVNGGGIGNFSGSLTINNSVVSGNSGSSGAIFNTVPQNNPSVSPASVTINNSTLSGNTGPGINNSVVIGNASSPATVAINNSTISGNSLNSAGSAAGIRNGVGTGGIGTITVTNSTISGNTNSSNGAGAIYNAGVFSGVNPTIASVTVTNSTIFGNVASSGSGAVGGITNIISSCGGCNVAVKLRNSIVAGNTLDSATASDVLGTLDSNSSFNLIGVGGSGGITNGVNNNQVGVANPGLSALANNGGPTQTHAPLPGSLAINAGSNANLPADTFDLDGDGNTAEPIPFDQRGLARITNTTVDIGAFESRGFTIAATSGSGQTTSILTAFGLPLKATVSSAFGEPVAGGVVTFVAPPNASGPSASFPGSAETASGTTDNSGVATSPTLTANTSAGSYNVTASPGAGSPTAAFALSNKASTFTQVTSSVNPSNLGQSVTFTAAVSTAGGTPTGTVQFKDGGTNLGSPQTLDNSFPPKASISTTSLSGGTHTITADYSGDAKFFLSSSLSIDQVVKPPSITISDVSITEGDSGTRTLTFVVNLSETIDQEVKVNYATADGTATAPSDYESTSGTLTFGANTIILSRGVNVTIKGDQSFEPDETLFLNLSNSINADITDNQGMGTILNDDVQGGVISLGQSSYSVNENGGLVMITVNRTGNTTGPATVDYATSDGGASLAPCSNTNGQASARCDFTTALGTFSFAAGETQKTFVVLVNRDSYAEGQESFTVNLSNQTGGAVLASPSTATVTIADEAVGLPPNVIDDAQVFVRQHYHDFLNREPDTAGLSFWTNEITSCGTNQQCIENKRIFVSAAFFLSIEFQETGYLVERLYKTAYGDADQISNFGGSHPFKAPVIRASEFLPDTQEIGLGVVVGQTGWETVLENNKRAFTAEFVQRPRFTTAFPLSMSAAQFVDKLNTNAGNPLSATERNTLVSDLTSNAKTRAEVLRTVAEDPDLVAAESNRAFVLMQFFGYLRRNPNDAPDVDYTGYDFWLTKLNQFNGNFVNADMVKAFITSSEYRQRFGP